MPKFELSTDGTVGYSPTEKQIFSLLKEEPVSTLIITERKYGKNDIPFHGRKIVIGALSSLVRKTKLNREPFRIAHTKRAGPIPMTFWIERK